MHTYTFPALLLVVSLCAAPLSAQSRPPITYPYSPYMEGKMDPQITGWPLTEENRAYILKPRETRVPGLESGSAALPDMAPVTPSAGMWKDPNTWINQHTTLVSVAEANRGPVDIVLIGDSITQQWGGTRIGTPTFNQPWKRRFGNYKTLNLGIQGDTTQNILWRLDHGAMDGLQPRAIVLLIGTNNKPNPKTFTSVGLGVRLCVDNLRARFPKAQIIFVKVLPVAKEDIRRFNDYLDSLGFAKDPALQVLDLWDDLVLPDGTTDPDLYIDGNLHLSEAGYEIYAARLEPLLTRALLQTP
jgi:platelet-activating factor acetylhydrolase IB subunit beta/gamma